MKQNNNEKDKDLKDYGIIYLSGSIDDSISENICKEIIECNVAGKVDHIQIIINSSGGSCPAGFAIIDMMEWSRLPVYTTGIGMLASMALLIFMTGSKERRVITPRTSLLSHRFYWGAMGNHSQLVAVRKEMDLEHERILNHYLTYTNVGSKDELEQYLLRDVDTWLTPEEAVKYGIADIIEPLNRQAYNDRRK